MTRQTDKRVLEGVGGVSCSACRWVRLKRFVDCRGLCWSRGGVLPRSVLQYNAEQLLLVGGQRVEQHFHVDETSATPHALGRDLTPTNAMSKAGNWQASWWLTSVTAWRTSANATSEHTCQTWGSVSGRLAAASMISTSWQAGSKRRDPQASNECRACCWRSLSSKSWTRSTVGGSSGAASGMSRCAESTVT
jgi:hypothetical protein